MTHFLEDAHSSSKLHMQQESDVVMSSSSSICSSSDKVSHPEVNDESREHELEFKTDFLNEGNFSADLSPGDAHKTMIHWFRQNSKFSTLSTSDFVALVGDLCAEKESVFTRDSLQEFLVGYLTESLLENEKDKEIAVFMISQILDAYLDEKESGGVRCSDVFSALVFLCEGTCDGKFAAAYQLAFGKKSELSINELEHLLRNVLILLMSICHRGDQKYVISVTQNLLSTSIQDLCIDKRSCKTKKWKLCIHRTMWRKFCVESRSPATQQMD
eukprot:TRINITY_DN3668_c0_g1_i2.p1 TRINITY_DN3668_c0_g1~~TRINITY_DN3668_c0_g1_i2.p1  ORF type:complete len:272 (+),score=56.00 TRINITY_DN3668_c0_g1_i2:231-1046(+)